MKVCDMGNLSPRIEEEDFLAYSSDTGEYVQVEFHDEFFSLAWTTSKTAEALSLFVMEEGEEGDGATGTYLLEGAEKHQLSDAQHVIDVCINKTNDVLFARIDYPPGASYTWRAGRRFRDGNWDPPQLALMMNSCDQGFITSILRDTGTTEIAEKAREIAQAVASRVVAPGDRGSKWTAEKNLPTSTK
jgi:hypothetical protein